MPTSAKGLMGMALSAILAAASAASAQSVIYVDDDAPAGGDGASWATAHNSLTTALSAAFAGAEVRVGSGRYAPAGPGGDRNATFTLRSGVRLIGGYAGLTGADPDARDPAAFVSVLTGDLNSNDAPGFVNIADNSHHVLTTFGNVSAATRIDGLLITGGNAAGSFLPVGGGLLMTQGSPTVVGCTFYRNAANALSSGGGGVYSESGSPTFTDCAFVENSARYQFNVNNGFGGAVFIQSGTFTRCDFTGNLARDGGAVYADISITMTDCRFTSNNANRGGAIFRANSGPAPFNVTNCEFRQNSAAEGGAIGFYNPGAGVSVANSTFIGNSASRFGGGIVNLYGGSTVLRCVFSGNSATLGGGAIAATGGAGHVVNCTIANNTAGQGGGILLIASNSTVNVRNTILWDNSDGGSSTELAQIDRSFATGTLPVINYSCVMGLSPFYGGTGNIGLDPFFVDPLNGDLSLGLGSPCVNAGDPNSFYNDPDGSRNDIGAFVGVQNALPEAAAICQQLTSIGSVAIVRLDASGSSDPDNAAADLQYLWTVDGSPVCDGPAGSCAVIEVPMAFGAHTVTLRVTDPAGAFDEDTKTIVVDPAALALLRATNVEVDFEDGEFTFQGEIALPATLNHIELQPVVSAALNIGGVGIAPAADYPLAVRGRDGDKWDYNNQCGAPGAVSKIDIDWGGARFRHRGHGFPVKLQSDTITSTQSFLSMDFNVRRTGAFTMTVDDAVISVAADGSVTANVPVDTDGCGRDITVTLPFPIQPTTTFTFSGGVGASFTAADHLTSSVGRFRVSGRFDPALLPDGASTMPRTIDLTLEVGAERYPGTAPVEGADISIQPRKWRARN